MKLHTLAAGAALLATANCTSSTLTGMTFSGDTAPAAAATPADTMPLASTTLDADLVMRAGAPLFDGMGAYHRPVTGLSPDAQRYFDQGMVLAFGFNHAEAIRSFKAAQRLAPTCAMCYWGEALATGPNINVTSKGKAVMADPDRLAAHAAITRAMALKATASPVEQALIEAQAERYNGEPGTDRMPLDLAYAEAMGDVVAAFPDDDDAAAMFAEAWMNTMPWNYWSDTGEPRPETVPVIAELERILARNDAHPLALHLYIHAVEASSDPGRAEPAADRLAGLVPGSGHLVHMPSHIYWRVGRYQDAAQANVRAAGVDEAYIAACNAQGFYPALYYPHNIHFLWAASSMSGQSAVAIEAGQKVADNVHLEQIEQFPTVEFFKTIPLLSLVRFGRWQDILDAPQPPAHLDYSTAIWHYARGVARANLGDSAGAAGERAALADIKDTVQIQFLDSADYPASTLLNIADHLLQGELALQAGDPDGAVPHFEAAVALQDGLPYTEPPFWYYPTRQSLGQALLEAGDPAAAERVYRRDLEDYPRNGWSAHGLVLALESQGRAAEADAAREAFEIIWQNADIELTGSRL